MIVLLSFFCFGGIFIQKLGHASAALQSTIEDHKPQGMIVCRQIHASSGYAWHGLSVWIKECLERRLKKCEWLLASTDDLAKKLNAPLEISPKIVEIFKDGQKKYGSRAWSSMIVKRMEDLNNIDFRANGFPDELIDNEPEVKGFEI